MVSCGLYGAVPATASGGAMVSVERVWGWSRQLRVTPLSSTAYIVTKMPTALVLGASSVLAVYVVGGITNKSSMPLRYWVITAPRVWIGSLLFAAFGLFIGYLLPSENVMQIIGIVLTLCSFAGRVSIPLSQFSPTLRTVASSPRCTGSTNSSICRSSGLRAMELGPEPRRVARDFRDGRNLEIPDRHNAGLATLNPLA
jgi:ABC-2 type transport system permease protein